ncbi:MAG TPA: HAMP domain-containing protein, partial [Terriglobia bacterium]|nr:HAMP domain-containing protein [Terriglobia bacterium]
MSLRSRMLLAFGVVVLIPLVLMSFGLRQEVTRRLSEEYQARVDTVVEVIRQDLLRESDGVSERLSSLKSALLTDNRFRLAAVAGAESERNYLLDYAGSAMRLTGLAMFEIHDGDGRIISSGHFRNEHGRLEPALAPDLAASRDGVALVTARAPEGEFLALARSESLSIAGHPFTLIGGTAVDRGFLSRLARDPSIVVSLTYPGGTLSSAATTGEGAASPEPNHADDAVGALEIPVIRTDTDAAPETAKSRLEVTQSLAPLRTLQRSMDSWFLITALGAMITALALASWLSSRISRPLADLAAKTAVLDLDRLDVPFDGGTDEVGSLSRLLGAMAARLRTSIARAREAERRATIGDLARQINHDIKNGLIPLRNVLRHLEQVERDEPASLPAVFAERRGTIASSIAYLETLATSYQRLSPHPDRRSFDPNAIILEVARSTAGHDRVEFITSLKPNLPPLVGDPVAFRRIVENLTSNAVESLDAKPGQIHVSTEVIASNGAAPAVRVTV